MSITKDNILLFYSFICICYRTLHVSDPVIFFLFSESDVGIFDQIEFSKEFKTEPPSVEQTSDCNLEKTGKLMSLKFKIN